MSVRQMMMGRKPAASGPFSPLDLPGLLVWADASDTATVSKTATNLTAWEDKSGNANDAVITATHGNVYGTRTINSLNVMDLWVDSGSGNIYFPIIGMTEDATIFLLFQRDAGSGQLFDARNSGSATPLHDDRGQTGFSSRTRNDSSTLVNGNTGTQDLVPHIYAYRSDTSTFGAYLDGALIGGSTTARSGTLTGLDRLYVGTGQGGTNRTDVGLGEVIACSTALSAADRQATETYLADKWGVTL